jgi:hypothetical protein
MKVKKVILSIALLLAGILIIVILKKCFPPVPPCNLPAPATAQAVYIDSFTAKIEWALVPGAQSYEVVVKEAGGSSVVLDTLVNDSLDSVIVTGLKYRNSYNVVITPGCSKKGNLSGNSIRFIYSNTSLIIEDLVVMLEGEKSNTFRGLNDCDCSIATYTLAGEEATISWDTEEDTRKLWLFRYSINGNSKEFKIGFNRACSSVKVRNCDIVDGFSTSNNVLTVRVGINPANALNIVFLKNIGDGTKLLSFNVPVGGALEYSVCEDENAACED